MAPRQGHATRGPRYRTGNPDHLRLLGADQGDASRPVGPGCIDPALGDRPTWFVAEPDHAELARPEQPASCLGVVAGRLPTRVTSGA